MLKQIYTHLRSPFGLVAMAIVTVGAISATQHVPIKAQVSTETTCPVGKECCWHINNNECEREIYESTPFDNYKEYCELKAGQGKSVFETYEACAQGESTCRNGKKEVDPGEECDDDNNINDDECTNECQNAANMDNIIQSHLNEECDDGNPVNNDACTNEGKKARCGDGVTQPYRGETCDKGSGNDVVDENGEYCSSVSCTTVRVAQDDDEDEDENEDDDKDQGSNSSASSRKSQSSASSVKTVTTPAQPEQKPVNTTNSNTVLPSVPSVPEESAETAEAKKKAEEEKKKAEEERLEEQQKILEDILERSLEDAKEKDVKNDDTVLEDNPDTTTVETKTEPVVVKQQNVIKEDDLRCTDADGNLTTDRSKCDYVKEQEIRKPVTITIPEPEIEKKIRENVLGSDIVQKRSDSLLVTLRDLRARTENIANSEEFNTEVEQYLQDVLDWLDRGIEYFSSELRSLEDINRMTGPVRQLAEQTSVLIKQQKNLPLQTPDINPILTRTEALLAKFRESFIALAQGKVALPQESLQKFVEAVNLYDTVKALCLEDDDECIRINEVLEKLKDVRSPLQDALEANPEIYKAVQAKFEE